MAEQIPCYRCETVIVPKRIAFCKPCKEAMLSSRQQICMSCRAIFDPTLVPWNGSRRTGYYKKRCNPCARKLTAQSKIPSGRKLVAWTEEEEKKMITMYNKGRSTEYIARVLKRSPPAISARIFEVFGTAKRAHYIEMPELCSILGIKDMVRVRKWIQKGWMPGAKRITKTWYGIDYEDFLTWLANRDYWMLWDIADITSPEIQRHALEVREGKGYWVTTDQVVDITAWSKPTIVRSVQRGELSHVVREKLAWYWIEDVYEWAKNHERLAWESRYGKKKSEAG